jgi:hypothetical protein
MFSIGWTRAVPLLFVIVVIAAVGQPSAQGTRPQARPAAPARPAVPAPAPTGHLPHAALETELRTLASAHAASATLVEMGRTGGGRRLWAIEIAAPGPVPPAARPGVLVVANLSADQVAGSTLAVGIARALLTSTDEGVRRQLEACTFYFVPRLDADGTEAVFAPLAAPRRGNLAPFDDDNDGRADEDPPEDLNGDGVITTMRVKDPAAAFAPAKDEPRLMRRAEAQKGEAGGWAIYWEGVDSDGDGFLNEDGIGGTELDRNFPHLYPAYTAGAGRFMMSEEESRALLDYVLARRNIAAVVAFGATDTLVGGPQMGGGLTRTPATMDLAAFADEATGAALAAGVVRDPTPPTYQPGGIFDDAFDQPVARPPAPTSTATRPATSIDANDLEVFRHVAERYKEITGIRQLPPTRKAAGAFHEWGYFQFGVPAFATPGATLPPPASAGSGAKVTDGPAPVIPPPASSGDGGPGADDGRLLAWIGAARPDAIVPWTPFQHPTLGAVEIGGWRPFAAVPPASAVTPLVAPHMRFLVELSTFVPRVGVASVTATRLGGGLYRVRAEVENRGRWPTALQHAVTARAVKPVLVQIDVEPAAIVSGAPRNQFFPTLAGSGRRERIEWIVRARPGQTLTVKVVAQKGGTATGTARCE